MTLKLTSCVILLFMFECAYPQAKFIKVHFLYGSKPKREFRDSEPKWFGGKLGGHVGIEIDSNRILNFVPAGSSHIFPKMTNKHSRYWIATNDEFYNLFSKDDPQVKLAVFKIPINDRQKAILDSLSLAYVREVPYDYAFFGMRCAAATYDILAHLGILPTYTVRKTARKIFYPRKLRKRLFKIAPKKEWQVMIENGSQKRKWDKD